MGYRFFLLARMLKTSKIMSTTRKADNLLSLTVVEGLTVDVIPNTEHEYFMTTKEVAKGYGISDYTLRRHKMEQSTELLEGRHFVTAVQILNGKEHSDLKIPHNTTLWTKRGVVRLGFFIKSERAKLFRDWAEELIIAVDAQRDLFGMQPVKKLPAPRRHNRLTQERLISILADVAEIEDTDLRMRIVSKLLPKGGVQ